MNEFTSLAKLADLPESGGLHVTVADRWVALFKVEGEVFALDGHCPHRGAPLGEGTVVDGTVFCPLHGWQFEVRTGACLDRPDRPAKSLPVRVVDGQIQVQL